MRRSRCYLLKYRVDVSASQRDIMKETKEHRSYVIVTHQKNQVHLASPQETGIHEAKAVKSAQCGRIHQTLPCGRSQPAPVLAKVPPHVGHSRAARGQLWRWDLLAFVTTCCGGCISHLHH